QLANGGGLHPARNIVGGDFLHLVRFGIRDANDPVIRDSIEVIARVLKYDLLQGPGWRRYNHDGYGQKDDGGAFDGTGVGRCWPILTGERGHYELAAGRDPKPFITTIENFSNEGGMITEQVWDGEDLPHARMKRGCPTGAAMPLCWSHAEYVSLVRSRHDGVCFDRVEPAYQRYVVNPAQSRYEIWTLRHPLQRVSRCKIFSIYLARHGETAWSLTGQHTGITDLPLTERGERNAVRLGERLAGSVFAKVMTSPLQRAARTCELAGFGAVAEVDRDLIEW